MDKLRDIIRTLIGLTTAFSIALVLPLPSNAFELLIGIAIVLLWVVVVHYFLEWIFDADWR